MTAWHISNIVRFTGCRLCQELIAQIRKCPSGALSYKMNKEKENQEDGSKPL